MATYKCLVNGGIDARLGEAAARNHLLHTSGYNAAQDLIARQNQAIAQNMAENTAENTDISD